MSESKWIEGPPTKPGWYWWWPIGKEVTVVYRAVERPGYPCFRIMGRDDWQYEAWISDGWHQPLTPPQPPEE